MATDSFNRNIADTASLNQQYKQVLNLLQSRRVKLTNNYDFYVWSVTSNSFLPIDESDPLPVWSDDMKAIFGDPARLKAKVAALKRVDQMS